MKQANLLGEIRAETDQQMLDMAFLETVDYKTAIGAKEKKIVVGRRGTGKSALAYKLHKYWGAESKTKVISLAPRDDQVIGLRYITSRFGETYNQIKTGVRISLECVLMLEVAQSVATHFKAKKNDSWISASEIAKQVRFSDDANIARNLRILIDKNTDNNAPPEVNIANLADNLRIKQLKSLISQMISELGFDYVVLIDRLDEGFEPDLVGSAINAGVIQGLLNVGTYFDKVRCVAFVRDNMYRSVIQQDPDYTRNIEGAELRLHWDEQQLYSLIMLRFKSAFGIEQNTETKVWNRKVANELRGLSGFRLALRLTLYRPRDLLSLLNEAFIVAARNGRDTLIPSDLETTAKHISQVRLDDLRKEYESILPAITVLTSAFANSIAEMSMAEADKFLAPILQRDDFDPMIQGDIVRIATPEKAIQELYSIGFIGLLDEDAGSFRFCHDGRSPDISLGAATRLLVHPCYQISLNLVDRTEDPEKLQTIHDDYRIELSSFSQEDRNKKVGQIVSRLRDIALGQSDAGEFEEWALEALSLVFAGSLRNIELHPNKDAVQRRDIVAENNLETKFWSRVHEDYRTRQVIIEIKNKDVLESNDFRQMAAYLVNQYGNFGLILYRADRKEPNRREIGWVKEIYDTQKKLILPWAVGHLTWALEKIRNPEKYDAVDLQMGRTLTAYERGYLSQRTSR